MTVDLAEDRDLALQLHKVLSEIDPARWRDEMAAVLKPKLQDLQAKFEKRAHHAALADTLKSEVPHLDTRGQWLAFKKRLQPSYIELAKRLKAESIHVPSLRPTNYARNVFHVGTAVSVVALLQLLDNPALVLIIAAIASVAAWSTELARRFSPRVNGLVMKLFNPVAHPHEVQRVNSATWYTTALLLLAATQSTMLCVTGVVVLGIGDPIAALVGRRFGRIKLLHGRSLEGTLAFALSATVATFAAFALFYSSMGLGLALGLAAAASIAGALAELFSLRVDDNFSIPLSAAAGVVVMTTLLQVAL
jgi:dolichol kinase